jgi:hypothetical protein
MGTLGLSTQANIGDLESNITGDLGVLKVLRNFTGANLYATATNLPDGQIGSVDIGGDLTVGYISTHGAIGNVRIGGDLAGNTSRFSGAVFSLSTIGNVRVGGNLIGGAGDDSGQIYSASSLGDIRIRGSLIGGAGVRSGRVISSTSIGNVRIGGDLIGGSVVGVGTFTDSGAIYSGGRIASVTLGGSLIAGNESSGTLSRCGSIIANAELGPVRIGGSVLGSTTNPALIIARGQKDKPATGFDVAIASLSVAGDVRFARILAGFDFELIPSNADASIGSVLVGGDWVAGSLVAGAQDTGAHGFGVGDTLQTIGDTPLISRITSITIKGDATGSLNFGDHFGFVAQQIDKLNIDSRVVALSANKDNVAIPFTDDLRLLEVG